MRYCISQQQLGVNFETGCSANKSVISKAASIVSTITVNDCSNSDAPVSVMVVILN